MLRPFLLCDGNVLERDIQCVSCRELKTARSRSTMCFCEEKSLATFRNARWIEFPYFGCGQLKIFLKGTRRPSLIVSWGGILRCPACCDLKIWENPVIWFELKEHKWGQASTAARIKRRHAGEWKIDDFGKFCYLDVQKTGSKFITNLLKECSLLPLLRSDNHTCITSYKWNDFATSVKQGQFSSVLQRAGYFRKNVIYFNSIRHPFNYYASLYNYGCDGRGGVYRRLHNAGFTGLYDGTKKGFLEWANFISNPENRIHIDVDHAKYSSEFIGFLTYRFLNLSFVDPSAELPQIQSIEDLNKVYDQKNISVYTVRNENLKKDLLELIDLHLVPFVERNRAVSCLDGKRINASVTKLANAKMLMDTDVGAQVKKQESFIFDRFYPS